MERVADLVIAGAGPAGLAAAIAARQRGLTATVVDAGTPPMDKACGEGLMPDSLQMLSDLGVELDPRKGSVFQGIRFVDGPRQVDARFPRGFGMGVRRPKLHDAMIRAAERAGVKLKWGTAVRGIQADGLTTDRGIVRGRWIVGADGMQSAVRRWAQLDHWSFERRRYGFRRHCAVRPWSEFVEVHWADRVQCYVTPVGEREVGIAMLTTDPALRYDDLPGVFPALAERLRNAGTTSSLRGSLTCSRQLRHVCRGNVGLIGDASGSVDAITGEGLCLAFRQAYALAGALATGDLAAYSRDHRRLSRLPLTMASALLLMDGRPWLRQRALAALAARPEHFAKLLALHVGEIAPWEFGLRAPLSFGLRFLIN